MQTSKKTDTTPAAMKRRRQATEKRRAKGQKYIVQEKAEVLGLACIEAEIVKGKGILPAMNVLKAFARPQGTSIELAAYSALLLCGIDPDRM